MGAYLFATTMNPSSDDIPSATNGGASSLVNATSESGKSRIRAASLTVDQVHAFLKPRYKHSRFEGRNTPSWGTDYSRVVAESHLGMVRERGYGMISQHESVTGEVVIYDGELSVRDDAFFHRIMQEEREERLAAK